MSLGYLLHYFYYNLFIVSLHNFLIIAVFFFLMAHNTAKNLLLYSHKLVQARSSTPLTSSSIEKGHQGLRSLRNEDLGHPSWLRDS